MNSERLIQAYFIGYISRKNIIKLLYDYKISSNKIISVFKAIKYRRKRSEEKKRSINFLLIKNNVTEEQVKNISDYKQQLELNENLIKNQNKNRYSKEYLINLYNENNYLKTLINNLEHILKIYKKIPTIQLAPKRRYLTRFNYIIIYLLLNVLEDSSNIKNIILLGSCNNIIKKEIVKIIEPYLLDYTKNRKYSVKKDLLFLQFYMSWFGGCKHYNHSNNCPLKILSDLSVNKHINNDIRRFISNNLRKKSYGFIGMLLKNHGVVYA